MRVVARCPATYRPEREYILDVVLSDFLGLQHRIEWSQGDHVELSVEGDLRGQRLVMPDLLLQVPPRDWLSPRALVRLPVAFRDAGSEVPEAALPAPIPVLFGAECDEAPLIEEVRGGLRLSLDVFGSVFYLLTRYEELVVPARDEHGRFPLSASIAGRGSFVDRALANEYVDLLEALLMRLWPRLPRAPRRSSVLLTHDVDVPYSVRHRSARQNVQMIAGDVLKRRDPGLAARRLRASVRRAGTVPLRDPAFTFDFIMSTGERFAIKSSFYFLAEPRGRKPAYYSLQEPWAQSLLRSIADRGHLLGLHVSYDAYLNAGATRREFETLLSVVEALGISQDEWGGRQHWLRWENPTTWRNWERAGLDYDATVGFEERPGFRCGSCRPFGVFDLKARRRLQLVEHPLHFMDSSLFDRGATPRGVLEAALRVHETCKRHGGEFVLLWHNDALASRQQRAAYVELLREIA